MRTRLFRYGLLAVLLALFPAAGVLAQEPAALPSEGHPKEGVAVHGHWTVTVVREGEVVDRREFENSLQLGGQAQLSQVMTGGRTPGWWLILVEADGTETLCANNEYSGGRTTACSIAEATGEMTVSVSQDDTILLEGSETVQRDGNIQLVNTYQQWCSGTVAPADCQPTGNHVQITRAGIDPVIPVQNGDEIQVTVELSFS